MTMISSFVDFMQSWRGVPVEERPHLLRKLGEVSGNPRLSTRDGVAVGKCLYCKVSAKCAASLDGDGKRAMEICPNLH